MVLVREGPFQHHAGGTRTTVYGFTQAQDSLPYGWREQESTKSPGPPYVQKNTFFARNETLDPGRFDGSDAFGANFRNWRLDGVLSAQHQYIGVDGFNEAWVTSALAGVNPHKPIVSLPNIVWELREIPSLLRDTGRLLSWNNGRGFTPPDVGTGVLVWNFGWAPLFSDLDKLLNLGLEVEKAVDRINRGQEDQKLTGTIVDRTDRLLRTETGFSSLGSLWREYETETKVWYSAHWTAEKALPMPFADTYQKAQWALGLRRPASIIWEAIPWSFLIDYFVNVGTFLEAAQGLLSYQPESVCLMARHRTKLLRDELRLVTGVIGTYRPARYACESKARWIRSHPTPSIRWAIHPVMEKSHIISALAITMIAGKSGRTYSTTG